MTSNFEKPEYRLRLFLSVDLTGSTAFKSKSDINNLQWLKAFQKFYGEFPSLFMEKYKSICDKAVEISGTEKELNPKVWKTIGDEILFVNRVHSITHLGVYVQAFCESLKAFGSEINVTFDLNTKGNGWIAAFPNPNCSIFLSKNGDEDPLSGIGDILTEDVEIAVDKNPSAYDFLGKGIDGGFRISRNSTIDAFTVSPALAYLLSRAKRNVETTGFDCEFQFHEPQQLKGVANGNFYPIVSIDTNRDKTQKAIKVLEAKLLQKPEFANHDELCEYLELYMDYNGIEKPSLKLSFGGAPVDEPKHYSEYIEQWESEVEKIKSAEAFEDEAESTVNANGAGEAVGNTDEALKTAQLLLKAWLDSGKRDKAKK